VSESAQDGRLLRGEQSRRTIVRRAVDLASLDGLDGLSFGQLATDLGISKGGIQTLFGTKENLQVAVVEAAREVFTDYVVQPALALPAGSARLRALIDQWLDYARRPLFPGGCFWAANLPVFDSRPGPVRDTLASQQRAWRGVIAAEVRQVADAPEVDADLVAFQIDAVLTSTNIALRLGDDGAADLGRRAVGRLLAPAGWLDRSGA
jgi:AcrR family transcriptional regulator